MSAAHPCAIHPLPVQDPTPYHTPDDTYRRSPPNLPPRARRAADRSDLPSATTASTLNPLSSTHEHAQWPHPAISTPWAQPTPTSRRAATRPKSNQIANPTPKLPTRPQKQTTTHFALASFRKRKKTLHYPTKLNIQTRPAGDPAVATPQPSPHVAVAPATRHSRSHHSVIPAKAGIQGGGAGYGGLGCRAAGGSPLPPTARRKPVGCRR